MIRFNCQHCGLPLSQQDEFIGTLAPCPSCAKPTIVPEFSTRLSSQVIAEVESAQEWAQNEVKARTIEAEKEVEAEIDTLLRTLVEAGRKKLAESATSALTHAQTAIKNATENKKAATRILGANSSSPTPAKSNGDGGLDVRGTLRVRFPQEVLGLELGVDTYLLNPFRILGLGAAADAAQRQGALQRYNALLKINPQMAARSKIATGYDDVMPDAKHEQIALAGLRDPHRRLLGELFWPHLDGEVLEELRSDPQGICSSPIQQNLWEQATLATGLDAVLRWHALAVIGHNQALSMEFKAARDEAAADACWQNALQCWAHVLSRDEFWEYFGERATSYDNPMLGQPDIAQLREQLPVALLSFNTTLASCYAQAGDYERCQYHLSLVNQAPMSVADREAAILAGLSAIATTTLEPLANKIRAELPGGSDRVSRKVFAKACDPLLAEAFAIHSILSNILSEDALAKVEFDSIASLIQKALASQIDYKDDRERALHYSLIVTSRLLELPLSAALSASLRQGLREDRKHLYGDFDKDSSFDPARCWFLDGVWADPDCSETFKFHKITDSSGGAVRWTRETILVPRSRQAEQFHRKVTPNASDLAAELAEQGRRYWCPSNPNDGLHRLPSGGIEPVSSLTTRRLALIEVLNARVQGTEPENSLLMFLEACRDEPKQVREALTSGRAADWLEKIGQPHLAQAARQCSDGSVVRFLPILRSATVCDVWAGALQSAEETLEKIDTAASDFQQSIEQIGTQVERMAGAKIAEARRNLVADCAAIKVTKHWEKGLAAALGKVRLACLAEQEQPLRLARENVQRASQALQKVEALPEPTKPSPGVTAMGFAFVLALAGMGWWIAQGLHLESQIGFVGAVGLFGGAGLGTVAAKIMGSIDLSTNSKRHRAILASAQKHQKSANETLNRLERSIIGPLQDRIEDVHRQAAAKIAEAERRVQAFRAGCEAEINACVGNVSALALRLRQAVDASSGNGATELERLAKCCQAREVSTKSTFPPLRRIQSSGYSSGERPSESDLRRLQEQEVKAFWDSFGYDEKQKLAQLLRVLGERESSKLLEALMDMTPSERRNVLRGLPIF